MVSLTSHLRIGSLLLIVGWQPATLSFWASAENPYLADSLIDSLPQREDAAGQRSSLESARGRPPARELWV
jgi:hypothetical protein